MSLFYFKNFLRDKNIGSITPTSQIGVKTVCQNIDFSTAKVIVEFGPGGGVFTKYLLSKLAPDAKLIAFELNPTFIDYLSEEIQDKRFVLFEESAELIKERLDKEGISNVDAVVSGIPFSFFDIPLKEKIIKNTLDTLRPNGRIVLYQFFPPPRKKEERMSSVLKNIVGNDTLRIEPRNIPPLVIYEAVKN